MSHMSKLDIKRKNIIEDGIRKIKRNIVIQSLIMLATVSIFVWCLACTDRMWCWIHLIVLGVSLIALSFSLTALKKVRLL